MTRTDPTPAEGLRASDFIAWILLALLTPFSLHLTDLMDFGAAPLPQLLVIYLAWRTGRWGGALAGLAVTLPWLVGATVTKGELGALGLLQGGGHLEPIDALPYLTVPAPGLQQLVLVTALGFGAGWLAERLRPLARSIHLPAPSMAAPPRSLLALAMSALDARGAGPPAATRAPWRQWLIAPALVMALVIALCALNLTLVLRTEPLLWHLPPLLLPAVVVLAVAFVRGPGTGVVLALVVAASALPLTLLLIGAEIRPGREMYPQFSTAGIGAAAGLAMLAWCAARAGLCWRDAGTRSALREWLAPYLRAPATPSPPLLLIPALLLLGLGVQLHGAGLVVALAPYGLMFVLLCLAGQAWQPARVSNLALPCLAVLAVVAGDERLAWRWNELETLGLYTQQLDMALLVLLAAAPLAAGHLDLRQRGVCRALAFGFMAAALAIDVALRGGLDNARWIFDLYWLPPPTDSLRAPRPIALPLACAVLHLLFFEAVARVLHRAAGGYRTRDTSPA